MTLTLTYTKPFIYNSLTMLKLWWKIALFY